jgi:hypothetical protein
VVLLALRGHLQLRAAQGCSEVVNQRLRPLLLVGTPNKQQAQIKVYLAVVLLRVQGSLKEWEEWAA